MSMSSENSENNNNNNVTQTNGTYWQSIANCVNRHSKLLPYCVFRQSLRRLDDAISSNETWQLNDYVSLKKNEDWKPIVLQARAMRTPYGQLLSRVSDLLMSRSLQFTLPPHDDDGSEQREARYFGSSGSGGHGGGGGGHDMEMGMSFVTDLLRDLFIDLFPSGRKKKKGGVKFGGVALIAMVAQLFMGKIAFLAGASLLISKLALIFSIFVR